MDRSTKLNGQIPDLNGCFWHTFFSDNEWSSRKKSIIEDSKNSDNIVNKLIWWIESCIRRTCLLISSTHEAFNKSEQTIELKIRTCKIISLCFLFYNLNAMNLESGEKKLQFLYFWNLKQTKSHSHSKIFIVQNRNSNVNYETILIEWQGK